VRATITNGLTASVNYTQDFPIVVSLAFVPVIGISGVPTTATAGTELNLSGTVAPANATNKTINWSVQNAGTTGAVVSGNTLNATGAGTVIVRATITNGLTASVNYTQDFSVTVSLAFVAVTNISGVSTTATVGTGLTLSGTVAPSNATNKTIVWSVPIPGPTGATLSGNTLNTTAAGTVTVLATIANGSSVSSNYTQEFNIIVSAGPVFVTAAEYRETIPILTSPTAITVTSGSSVFISGRTVTLSPFRMAKYETTYQLWKEVYDWAVNHGYTIASPGVEGHGTNGTGTMGTAAEKATRPVTTINWRDAIIWCNAYSEMSGKTPVYYMDDTYTTMLRVSTTTSGTATEADKAVMKPGANGYRLPTEAEWEFAARGGNQGDAANWGYTYAGSGTVDSVAWYSGNAGSTVGTSNAAYGAHPVGTKTGNGKGLYDMSGNVWEWCWDWYGTISSGTVTDPVGATSGGDRVLRGGSWSDNASSAAVSYRNNDYPGSTYNGYGFRLVCPPRSVE
jgi:formylglycine-generating enzyme required for sulfatase activity